MEMQLVNLTKHTVVVVDEVGEIIVKIPPSGQHVRLQAETQVIRTIYILGKEIPIRKTFFGKPVLIDNKSGEIIGEMPEQTEGTIFIVSGFVLTAVPDRVDLVRPDTGSDSFYVNNRRMAVRGFTR